MLRELNALTRREFLRLARNPAAIFTSLLLPLLYLLLFGQGFNLNPSTFYPGATPAFIAQFDIAYLRGAPNYYSYFAAGMTGFVSVTATLFIGANVIFDKLFGVFKRTRGPRRRRRPSSAPGSSRARPSRSCSRSSFWASPSCSATCPGSRASMSPPRSARSGRSRSSSRSSCSP